MAEAFPASGVEEPAVEGSTPAAPAKGAAAKRGVKGSASASSLKATFTPTADESAHVQKVVREALRAHSVQIMDLFVEWDTNGDGVVTKPEFRKAMSALGINHPRPHIDAVFDSLDLDHSGSIDFKELNKGLKRAAPKKPKPTADELAVAAAQAEADAAAAAKEAGAEEGKVGAVAAALAAGPQRPKEEAPPTDAVSAEAMLQARLRDALIANSARVIDLFQEWDTNHDGQVSTDEFLRALPLIGLDVSAAAGRKLFASFDADNTGTIELDELQQALRAGGREKLDSRLQAGAVAVQTEAVGKSRVRKHKARTGMKVDAALAKAFQDSAEPEADDSDEEDGPFMGAKIISCALRYSQISTPLHSTPLHSTPLHSTPLDT